MLYAGFLGWAKDSFPIMGAVPAVGRAAAIFHRGAGGALVSVRGVGVLDPVFYVDEGETAGIFLEVGQRIFAGHTDPAEVEFHANEFGIQFGEEKIVREFAAKRIGLLEL